MLRQVYVDTISKNKPHLRSEDGAASFSENLAPINKASQHHTWQNVAMFNILHLPALIFLNDFNFKINSLCYIFIFRSRGSPVCIATRLRACHLRNRGSIPGKAKRFFSSPNIQTGSAVHAPFFRGYRESLLTEV